jgi:hypothetical protein
MDLIKLLGNPLTQSSRSSHFLRLVLSEAGNYGMPGDVIAALDDIAAMLGFYDPIPKGQAAHLAGPLINWRTNPKQPSFERIHDVEKLAYSQRALIAFGGGRPGQMVGTAEIVCAMGNLVQGTSPPEYYDVFQWASLDVLKTLTGDDEETILADPGKKSWKKIADDDVLKPGGRLYPTYQTIATTIRREAIAAMENKANHPRQYLRPLAVRFLESHTKVSREAEAEGLTDIVERLDEAVATIRIMFPDLKDFDTELAACKSTERVEASS